MPSILSDITTRLIPISDNPALEASVLIAHIANKSRTWIKAHPELTLTTAQQKQLNESLTRLERGEPFPYVLSHWEFFGLDFDVTPDVLIPRPETELLVEKAHAWLNDNPNRRNIADVGTGSGAIAISLTVNVPDANTLATDISSKALQVAKRNAKKFGVLSKINFIECDLLPEGASIDLLCANLPYIPTEKLYKLSVYGREPTLALDGGSDGFEIIQKLMNAAPKHMKPNALMLFEFEETLGKQALTLAKRTFANAKCNIHKDFGGRDRLLEIQLP